MNNQANPEHPIHELLAKRWSPIGLSVRSVSEDVHEAETSLRQNYRITSC